MKAYDEVICVKPDGRCGIGDVISFGAFTPSGMYFYSVSGNLYLSGSFRPYPPHSSGTIDSHLSPVPPDACWRHLGLTHHADTVLFAYVAD